MENHAVHPILTIGLRVKIHDCHKCTQKLGKILRRIEGVYWVDVEPKKELVTVTGEAEPAMVIKHLESKKIKAKLLYLSKNKTAGGSENGDYKRDEKNGKVKNNALKPEKVVEESTGRHHVMEAYEPPKIDPAFCRDPYCKLHKCRPFILSKVPSIDSADHPQHLHGFSFPPTGGGRPFPYGGDPMMEPRILPPYSATFMPGGPHGVFGYYAGAANFPGSYM